MAVSVVGFDNVEVLQVGVTGPAGANTLFLVCGVAIGNLGIVAPLGSHPYGKEFPFVPPKMPLVI